MLKKIIESTNLTDKEGRLYLAALQLGSSTITSIAKLARINRVTAYSIAAKLIEKGFLNQNRRGKINYYLATDPQTIYEQIKTRTTKLKSLLPDLRRIHKTNEEPYVRYYEGLEGIKNIYLDSLKSSTEILNYANSQEIRAFWPEYDADYVQQRINKNIYLRGFAPDDSYGQTIKALNPTSHREIKLLPTNKAFFHNETNIYDDKIAMVSLKGKPMGIIIQNQELSDTQKAIFELLWEAY